MIDNNSIPQENDWTTLLSSIRNINKEAMGIIATSTEPTEKTVPPGKMVVYDDGAGTKRIYFRTGKDNVGYIALT